MFIYIYIYICMYIYMQIGSIGVEYMTVYMCTLCCVYINAGFPQNLKRSISCLCIRVFECVCMYHICVSVCF